MSREEDTTLNESRPSNLLCVLVDYYVDMLSFVPLAIRCQPEFQGRLVGLRTLIEEETGLDGQTVQDNAEAIALNHKLRLFPEQWLSVSYDHKVKINEQANRSRSLLLEG